MKKNVAGLLEDRPKLVKGQTIWVLILIFFTALVYSSAVNNGFTSWDDQHYVTQNRFIKDFSKEGLWKLWTKRTGMGGTRLTLTSFMLDYKLWGLNPVPYHIENIFWHLLNVLLLYFLLMRLVKKRGVAFITAMLFAIHPMHVESVAWISERKDVLYTFFLLLCLHSYISYVKVTRPGMKALYWLAFNLCFWLSWHAKFTAVIIPPLLFLLDYILQRRLSLWLFIEKLPILAFTASEVYRIAFGAQARMDFQGRKKLKSFHQSYRYSLLEKSMLAAWALLFYLQKFFFPAKLSAIVPYPPKIHGSFPPSYTLALVVAPLVLALVFFLLFRLKRDRRICLAGFLFFLISIAPFLHFISIKGVVVVADRYSYVPYIGLGLVVATLVTGIQHRESQWVARGLMLAAMLVFAVASFQRNKIWKDDISLFSSVLRHDPNVMEALNNRGNAYCVQGKYRLALADFNRGIEVQPRYKFFYNNRARAYYGLDSIQLAIKDLELALRLDPGYFEARLNLADVYKHRGRNEEAYETLSAAIEVAPYRAKIYLARADILQRMDRNDEALADLEKALEVYPGSKQALFELGKFHNKMQDPQRALGYLQKVLELDAGSAEVYNELGRSFNALGEYTLALEKLDHAIELAPQLGKAYNNRGVSRFHINQSDEALADFNRAIELDSVLAEAYSNRGNLWAFSGVLEQALDDYERALELDSSNCLAMVNKGNVYFQLGDRDAACAQWARALDCGFTDAETILGKNCR